MNPKQLTNILVKLMGLWLCVTNVVQAISTLVHPSWTLDTLLAILPFAIGLVLIIQSQWIVEKLFQPDV